MSLRASLAARVAFAVSVVATVPTSAFAEAPDKEACVAAFDRGQRAEADRKLRRAQSELIVCAQESCPAVLRADCAGVLADVRRALPTIVLAADDGRGRELVDVRVTIGGELVTERLDGRAVPFDPGTFELTFETPGAAPVKVTRVIHEGEKNRVVRASFEALAVAREPVASSPHGRSVAGWVAPITLGVVGVASLGVAGLARLRFDDRVDDLRSSCAPACTPEQRSDLSSTLVTSNVALGIGLGALALGVVTWFVLAPASHRTTAVAMPGRFSW